MRRLVMFPRMPTWRFLAMPGEAARLLSTDTATIQRDRLAAATELQARFGGAVLLKGRGSIVIGSSGLPTVVPHGNPGMSSAGMGDVLTGITAGILAQCNGQDLAEVAAAAAYAHARAGDDAALTGERGTIASDLFAHLKTCLNDSG